MIQKNKLTRLNKFLAEAGVCSRRKADELITSGDVQVNGKTIKELGTQVDSKEDSIKVNGRVIELAKDKVYFAFHKPKNVVTTTSDPLDRPMVMEYFKKFKKHRLFPVGRLDWATEGLIFITNDGDFSNEVSNPKSKINKTYVAKIDGKISPAQLQKLKNGVTIIGGKVAALQADVVPYGKSKKYDWVRVVINEGKNRQIRKMFEKIGFDVKKLTRIAIGEYRLSSLRPGDYKELKTQDLLRVFKRRVEKTETTKNVRGSKKAKVSSKTGAKKTIKK